MGKKKKYDEETTPTSFRLATSMKDELRETVNKFLERETPRLLQRRTVYRDITAFSENDEERNIELEKGYACGIDKRSDNSEEKSELPLPSKNKKREPEIAHDETEPSAGGEFDPLGDIQEVRKAIFGEKEPSEEMQQENASETREPIDAEFLEEENDASREKRKEMTDGEIYEEFRDFIDNDSEEFKEFIEKNGRRQARKKNKNSFDVEFETDGKRKKKD